MDAGASVATGTSSATGVSKGCGSCMGTSVGASVLSGTTGSCTDSGSFVGSSSVTSVGTSAEITSSPLSLSTGAVTSLSETLLCNNPSAYKGIVFVNTITTNINIAIVCIIFFLIFPFFIGLPQIPISQIGIISYYIIILYCFQSVYNIIIRQKIPFSIY